MQNLYKNVEQHFKAVYVYFHFLKSAASANKIAALFISPISADICKYFFVFNKNGNVFGIRSVWRSEIIIRLPKGVCNVIGS